MQRALAIETSGRTGSVALVANAELVAEEAFEHGLRHAAELVPMIDRLCRRTGCGPRELREVYVSSGPGSFTGLRIGITLAKTLAFATGAKLVAVPTVRVLAENAPPEARHVIIVLDAKRDQIFTARFERREQSAAVGSAARTTSSEDADDGPRCGPCDSPFIEREPAHLDRLDAMLRRSPQPVHLLGEGIPYHGKLIPGDDPGVLVTPQRFWRARAAAVARIGMAMARRGQFIDPFKLSPLYIRRPEAEEKHNIRKREEATQQRSDEGEG